MLLTSVIVGVIIGGLAYLAAGWLFSDSEGLVRARVISSIIGLLGSIAICNLLNLGINLIGNEVVPVKGSTIEQVRYLLVNDPVLAQLSETDPPRYDAIAQELRRKALQGKSYEQIYALVSQTGLSITHDYLMSSDRESVEVMRTTIALVQAGSTAEPDICFNAFFDQEMYTQQMNQLLFQDQQALKRINSLYVSAIKANTSVKDVDWKLFAKDTEQVSLHIRNKHTRAVELLNGQNAENVTDDDKNLYCPLLNDFYHEVLDLPVDRAANVLRGLAAQDEDPNHPIICRSALCL